MSNGWKTLIFLVVCVAIIAGLLLGGRRAGEERIIDGLRQDGYDVVIDRSVEPGSGCYKIRVWERGIGWVVVER